MIFYFKNIEILYIVLFYLFIFNFNLLVLTDLWLAVLVLKDLTLKTVSGKAKYLISLVLFIHSYSLKEKMSELAFKSDVLPSRCR